MLRHLSAVILSSLMGSILGTLVLIVLGGGTGAQSPIRFVAVFSLLTMLFTFPGAMLLMYLTLKLADRGLTQTHASLLLLVCGTVVGAGVLAFSGMQASFEPGWAVAGALYGFLTAASFIAALRVLKGYPAQSG